jgi:hypothetical protein
MYGVTRATTTLVFSAGAGLLIWLATQISNDTVGGYWARVGLVAGAGLLMAFSQLLGGWTKWGWPRLSIAVFITAFIPVAIVSLWIILAGEPGSGWFHNHVMSWSRGIHVSGLVTDLLYYIPVLAFGTGLVFGFSFDTTGPVLRDRDVVVDRDREAAPVNGRRGLFGRRRTVRPTTTDARAADEPLTAERDATTASSERTTDRETVR